jgi:phage/plasmid-like protein (TIGR03299 family)
MTARLDKLPAPGSADILEKSAETLDWLRANVKVGFTDQRGPAWWANAQTKAGKLTIPDGSHFPGAIPLDVVTAQLDVRFAKGTSHVTYTDRDGRRQVTPDGRVGPIVNTGTGEVFSYPTAKYEIHPYLETLRDFIAAIQYEQELAVSSVGLLARGGQAFLQVVLPETLTVAGFGYQPYMLGATSVDLSRKTSFSTGALAGVCDNTVNSALLAALTILKVSHRTKLPPVSVARGALGLQLHEVGTAMGEAIAKLAEVPVTTADYRRWRDLMAPPPARDAKARGITNATAKRAEYDRLWNRDPKVKPWKGTALGILQLDNTFRTWNDNAAKVAGGIMGRNFANAVSGTTARADRDAAEALARVLDRRLVLS